MWSESNVSAAICSALGILLILIVQQHFYETVRTPACRRRRADDGMRCRGMCTHSEVLLQRVSILLLQVEGREEGCGWNI